MPNWCITEITITHEDENKIKELFKNIKKWSSYNAIENGFGEKWLGNIVLNAEVGTVDTGKETDIRCRGDINYINLSEDNEIIIFTETAWQPMIRVWLKVLEKYLPDAELIYYAEEPGSEIRWTNDPCADKSWGYVNEWKLY